MPQPPVGAPSVGIAPPIATPGPTPPAPPLSVAPPAGRGPRVVRFDEQVVSVKQGDTYLTLSRAYYGSDEYAIALQRHNLEIPASRLNREGHLVPGERVHIPDIHRLESTYPNLIDTVRRERGQ